MITRIIVFNFFDLIFLPKSFRTKEWFGGMAISRFTEARGAADQRYESEILVSRQDNSIQPAPSAHSRP
jgi:hypothetical protein